MPAKHIFLVEDDADDQELFISALEVVDRRLRYSTANNGLDAYNKLLTNTIFPDIIFLDLNMPLMNGQQFLTKVKEQEQFRDIPVIILTTSSNPKTAREVKALGAKELLTKPNTFSELTFLLQTVLNDF